MWHAVDGEEKVIVHMSDGGGIIGGDIGGVGGAAGGKGGAAGGGGDGSRLE